MKKRTFLTVLLSLIAAVCCAIGLAACAARKVEVTGVTLSVHELSIAPGRTATLTATVSPENAADASVTWSSSDEAVATVSQEGVVTGVTEGTANVTVTTKNGKTDVCAVTVETITATGVELPETFTLAIGTTGTLSATFIPANTTNQNVTWSSSNPDVATITTAGVVTAFEIGETLVTVTTEDGNFTAACTVKVVNKLVERVTLDNASLNLTVGDGRQLIATVTPDDAGNKGVHWTSSDESVATVSAQGVVTAVAAGTAKITVTTEDGGKTADCVVTVDNPEYSVHVKYPDGGAVEAGFKLKIDVGDELTTDASGNVTAQIAPEEHTVVFTEMPTKGLKANYTVAPTIEDIGDGIDITLETDGTGDGRNTPRDFVEGEFYLRLDPATSQSYKFDCTADVTVLFNDAKPISMYDNAKYSGNAASEYLTLNGKKIEFKAGSTYYIFFGLDISATAAETVKVDIDFHTHTYNESAFVSLNNVYHGHEPTCTDVCGTTDLVNLSCHNYVGDTCTLCNYRIEALVPTATTAGIYFYNDGENGAVVSTNNMSNNQKEKLKELVLVGDVTTTSGDQRKLTRISGFNSCYNLETIYVPATVTSIASTAFRSSGTDTSATGCELLSTVYITDLDAWCGINFELQSTSYPDRYGSAPFRKSGSGTIILNYKPLVDAVITVNVSAAAFYNVTSLKTVELSGNVTSIGAYAFAGCSNLEKVVIGAGVTSIGANAFNKCSSDLKIYFKGTAEQWAALNVTLPAGVTAYTYETNEQKNATGNFWHYESDNVTIKSWHKDYVLPQHTHTHTGDYSSNRSGHWYVCTYVDPDNAAEGVCNATVEQAAHSYTEGVCSVCGYDKNAFTDGLTFDVVGTGTDAYAVVSGIGSATDVTELSIPITYTKDGIVYPVTQVKASAFENNTTIESVKFNAAITLNAKSFAGCTNLTTLIINAPVTVVSSGITSLKTAFKDCTKLTEVYVKDFGTWALCAWKSGAYYSGPFVNETGNLYINEALFESYTASAEVPANLFYGVTSLKTVDLTGVTSIGAGAFTNCSGITEIKIDTLANWFTLAASIRTSSPFVGAPNAVLKAGGTAITSFNAAANNCTVIPEYAFYGIKTLTSVDLTGVTEVKQYAFYGTGISGVFVVPATLTAIGNYAFNGTDINGAFTVPATLTTIGSYAFANTKITELTVDAVVSLTSYQFNTSTLKKVTFNAKATVGTAGIGTAIQELYLNSPIKTMLKAFHTTVSKSPVKNVYVNTIQTWFSCEWTGSQGSIHPFDVAGGTVCKLWIMDGAKYSELTAFVASAYNVTELPAMALYKCSFLRFVDLSGVTSIGQQALYDVRCPIVLDGDLLSVGSTVFYNSIYNATTYIAEPVTIIVKGNAATGLTVVNGALPYRSTGVASANLYYFGTQAEYEASGWNDVTGFTKGGANDNIISASYTYFYSATEQSGAWHYGADGVTPELW